MLKMNELEKQSDTPKSTILYYLKEGLLPSPKKDKPNLHLYDESCVEIIELIKYLQGNFNSTIAQIKALFASEEFDINNPYETLLGNLELIMGANLTKIYKENELCEEFNISKKELKKYVDESFLVPRNGIFTSKEREILAIVLNSNEDELKMIKEYVSLAKKLAKEEINLTLNLIKSAKDNKNKMLKHLFDILLILKPYILNMHTLSTYQKETK
ncbi:MAG: MerR family transcriptional regulator [Campylobacter sp.]|nr:MerR family transcriptional regulator [Campylobacter sp.]